MFEQVSVRREIIGNGTSLLLEGDGSDRTAIPTECMGQAQFVYVDPPFMTGEAFERRRFFGEDGWRKGGQGISYPAYSDAFADRATYMAFLRRVVENAHELLQASGVFCLHLDWRSSPHARLLCDEIFGEDRFLNEIIWAYESGGRAKRYFSRKHDVILMYARSKRYRFDITQVPLQLSGERRSHMKRQTDEDGRSYRSIRSAGKEYRYYDDAPVYPGDVWTDISHLQQKDPERTGYATQKPLKLLQRLMLPVVCPGDLVCDLCCGSGTTLAAANQLGCRFLGMDRQPEAIAIAAARLDNFIMDCACTEDNAALLGSIDTGGQVTLTGFDARHPAFPPTCAPMDALESWALGRLTPQGLRIATRHYRTRKAPMLCTEAQLPEGDGLPAVSTTDGAGQRRVYVWRER